LAHIDFLKIDVEGHDKFVLDGFDWEADRPDVVLAEFEDAKTLRNGYSAHDLAGSLLFRGYSVFVSEWLPIERYGLAHDWRRLVRYSPTLELGKSWGNLLAFLEEPDQETLRLLVEETIKFARKPEDRVSSAEAKAGVRALISDGRFRRANELFRSGSFEAALQEYLMLYDQTPFRIYEQNALWAARKLGYTKVRNAADFEMDVCGQWRPRPDVGPTGK
jgi:hypothetical protein